MTRTLKSLLAATVLSGLSAPAHAGPFDIPQEQQTTFIDVGTAYVGRAAYVGSRERDEDIFPYLAAEYKGRYFANAAQGVGVNLINRDGWTLAPIAYFAGGRDAEDTPFRLANGTTLPAVEDALDLDSSITVGGLVTYRLPLARLDAQMQVPVTGDVEGYRTDVSLTTRLPLGERIFIAPGLRASYFSDGWSNSYYGLNAAQAAAVGLPEYDAGAGFNSLGALVLASFEIVEDYNIVGALNYSLLQGDAKDSPLSPENDAVTVILGVARRF